MEYRIWEILEKQGRSLKWLAQRTGYGYSYIRQIRAGLYPVTAEFKHKCEWALEIPVDILFSYSERSGSLTETAS